MYNNYNINIIYNDTSFLHHLQHRLTLSMPAVPNCCCSKGPPPYWSNPPFLFFGHSGALALKTEIEKNSIKNGEVDQYGKV